jgi:hypothetical protein
MNWQHLNPGFFSLLPLPRTTHPNFGNQQNQTQYHPLIHPFKSQMVQQQLNYINKIIHPKEYFFQMIP